METQDAAGTLLLSAGFNENDGAQGSIFVGDGATITSAATTADAITLRAFNLVLDETGSTAISATGVGGGIRFFTANGFNSIDFGGTFFNQYEVNDAELALFTD